MSRLRRLAMRVAGGAGARIGHDGPVTDHFDGRYFYNTPPIAHSFADMQCWLRHRESHPWQRTASFTPARPAKQRVDGLRVTWINHASVLIQTAGHNLLTDPIYARRASPIPGLGPRRYHPPGIAFDDLPAIDTVLISHAHYDHLDRPTLKRLCRRDQPLVVAGLGLAEWLRAIGVRRVASLDWWQTLALPGGGPRLTATPARHWSRRRFFDRNRSLWLGYWLDSPAGGVYFAGDTGMGDHFEAIRERLGAPRLALLPIGAYAPRWFMGPQHIDPRQAVAAHRILGARRSIGIHFATFKLSDEARDAPAAELARARAAAGLPADAFTVPAFGACYDLA